jgi:hypothetical protein
MHRAAHQHQLRGPSLLEIDSKASHINGVAGTRTIWIMATIAQALPRMFYEKQDCCAVASPLKAISNMAEKVKENGSRFMSEMVTYS